VSSKFIRRTLRNVLFRDRPYFAHLALTHRCNLRCRFCHVQEEKFEELDTEGMKRVIDVLDRMGVAVLSISGGGEPLLRSDFATILNYAARKGLYTKITSNGTMPLERYRQLLNSEVKEIAISVDGVQGNDLPFGHVGPGILRTIRYLNDHLPPGKQLTLNITVSQANRDQVEEIVSYCTREYPNAKLWLNPVVAGSGKLRTATEVKVSPDYLRRCESPTLLSVEFYKQGVEEQYRGDADGWGCKAGGMFFDIKPNGDFWICQDQPSRTPLNILEPDFKSRLRKANFSYRRECSGCTYSCYLVTQEGFQVRNWPQMAGLWWKANTRPDERCREVAANNGWLSGLLSFCVSRLKASAATPVLSALLALLLGAGLLLGQARPAALDSEEVLFQMERSNAAREQELATFRSLRSYVAANSLFRRQARVTVEFRFDAPGDKTFRITQRTGSRAIQSLVIEPLMATERANASLPVRREVDICRRNYVFTFSNFDENARAYLFEVQPRTPNKYLFRGKVWVNGQSFAIQRIEGEPAKSPSFWVKRTHFVHEYAQFGSFWFPVRHHSEAELRLFGRSNLVIEYFDYRWEATSHDRKESAGRPGPDSSSGEQGR
jgi:MoaA/NifB/PqqE/SkfB family radical SAM enzyme